MLFIIESVNENSFKNIPIPCKYCLYWQTNDEFNGKMLKPDMEEKKKKWFDRVEKEFNGCIKIAYLNDAAIGFMQFAPARFFPRVKEYAAGPPSEDTIFIACLYIAKKEERGKGFGTAMLKDLIAELKKRRFKAIETLARKSSAENPSGPLEFYLKHGFKIIDEKDDFPLVRLEL
jgi:GNAT superfamily N-acetyltransferase